MPEESVYVGRIEKFLFFALRVFDPFYYKNEIRKNSIFFWMIGIVPAFAAFVVTTFAIDTFFVLSYSEVGHLTFLQSSVRSNKRLSNCLTLFVFFFRSYVLSPSIYFHSDCSFQCEIETFDQEIDRRKVNFTKKNSNIYMTISVSTDVRLK